MKSHKRYREVSHRAVLQTELSNPGTRSLTNGRRSLTNGSVRTQVSQTEVTNCEVSQTNSSLFRTLWFLYRYSTLQNGRSCWHLQWRLRWPLPASSVSSSGHGPGRRQVALWLSLPSSRARKHCSSDDAWQELHAVPRRQAGQWSDCNLGQQGGGALGRQLSPSRRSLSRRNKRPSL